MTHMKQHPLSAAFPAMLESEFLELVEDIRKHGQRDPIMIHEGMVLDGWHRYRACSALGIEPKTFSLGDGDPVAFVESVNLHRRHLSASQRAMAVVTLKQWAPAGKPNVAAAAALHVTNEQMAREAKVSPRTIRDAKAAQKAGLAEPVRDGRMTVEEAAALARGKSPAESAVSKKPPKRTLEPQRPADVHAPADADELAEAHHTITELAQENERLQDRLAVEAMDASEDEKLAASETIGELRARVVTLEAEVEALKVSRDTYMREASEAKKSAIYWRKQAEKAAA